MNDLIEELQTKMCKLLPDKRYRHTLSVAHLAASLAMCYGEDTEAAMIAGLLHDCAKCISDEEMLKKCRKAGIEILQIEENKPYLLHGKLGAYYAEHEYGIDNPEILSAIRCHTSGKINMTFLEMAVFLADYIEIGRRQPSVPPLSSIRTIAFSNIELAVYHTLNNMTEYLESLGEEFDETTVLARNYYKNRRLT